MKKIIIALGLFMLCLGITGCGSKEVPVETGYRGLTWKMEEQSVKDLLDQNKDLVYMSSKDNMTYGSVDVNDPMVLTSINTDDFVYETYTFNENGLAKIEIEFRSKYADLTTYLRVVDRFDKDYGAKAELIYHSDISDCYMLTTEKATVSMLRMVVGDGYAISVIIEPIEES